VPTVAPYLARDSAGNLQPVVKGQVDVGQ